MTSYVGKILAVHTALDAAGVDLAVFKALFDRPKDWVDIGEMLAFGSVDRTEVSSWLVRLLGAGDPRVTRFAALD